ncbi:hypothetical protein DWB85_08725 [Seongchinamella sediminis]|uniref:Uncharacterized protein n=2 Tax=Seongchinamella sediminis TaxID=2283635 RepID=A0A3L7DZC0_9GAMM|nr:hypothetical protein DWB85_08725 [Seongchinamella sediminis]
MARIVLRITGEEFDEVTCEILNSSMYRDDENHQSLFESILDRNDIQTSRLSDWTYEDDKYSVFIETTSKKVLNQIDQIFLTEDIFGDVSDRELIFDGYMKLGYSGPDATWWIDKNRPDLVARLKKELNTDKFLHSVSSIERTFVDITNSDLKNCRYKDYQLSKSSETDYEYQLHIIDDVLKFGTPPKELRS